MAWESALDRLMLQQIHAAEKGSVKPDSVRQQILELRDLGGGRPGTAFLMGYARTLLGLDLPEPGGDPSQRRWFLFGRVRGHDRRGERNWVAEMVQDPRVLVDLLAEPRLAAQCLPLVVRILLWCDDPKLAVRAVQYLAAESSTAETDLVVDAAITDLLARLEKRVDREDQESTAAILAQVLAVPGFDRLPADIRSRYHRALAERRLLCSEWDQAREHLGRARNLATANPRLRSAAAALGALVELRVHGFEDLTPQPDRTGRDAALRCLAHVEEDPDDAVPEALYVRSVLAAEVGDTQAAVRGFEKAIQGMRRVEGRDRVLIDRARYHLSACLLTAGASTETSRALKLMEQALATVRPDIEGFYGLHELLKKHDRKLALRFLDALDIGRGSSPDQLLFIALEYQGLGEAEQAAAAARRVLQVAANLDQRIEAMRVLLTAHNMKGEREQARAVFHDIRDLLTQRGAFVELERLLKNEEFVGQALDHFEIKCELAAVYEEMEGRDFERAQLQVQIARSLRARKEVEALRQAHLVLQEVACAFPELARDDLQLLERLLEMNDAETPAGDDGRRACQQVQKALGQQPRVLVVGGNERQRRHHPRFEALAANWGFAGEWLMTNYTSPQKIVGQIADRIGDTDLLLLLHWNRHETTEPALELARKAGVPARTVHYAGFTSLQVALQEMLEKGLDRVAAR